MYTRTHAQSDRCGIGDPPDKARIVELDVGVDKQVYEDMAPFIERYI